MLDRYREKAALCKTVNEFNRMHIDLERDLSPTEFMTLGLGILRAQPPFPHPSVQWAGGLGAMLARSGQPVVPHVRHTISESAHLFALAGPIEARRDRTLVVCFTDWTRRMMMPLPLFMQHGPPGCDYLVLFEMAQSRTYFLGGVPGLADSLAGLIAWLGRWVPEAGYRRVVGMGPSSGGLASMWCPVALGWDRAVSVAGAMPGDVPADRHPAGGYSLDDFRELVHAHRGKLPESMFVFSDGHENDRRKGETIAKILPTTLECIPGAREHNVLYEVFVRGELRELMRRMIAPA